MTVRSTSWTKQSSSIFQGEIEREYSQDLRTNVLSMLFDLTELQTYTAVRAELISITENFIPYLLGVGDFRSVAYLLRELRSILERARELLPEHRKAIEQLPAKLSQSDVLGQLLQSLDEAVLTPTEDELSELFGELRPEALQSVLEWLPRLSNENVREPLERAASATCVGSPGSGHGDTRDRRGPGAADDDAADSTSQAHSFRASLGIVVGKG